MTILNKSALASRDAFSLVELLLYVGILGIVGGLLTGILTTATKTQIQQTSQDKLSGELSFAMSTIQRLVQQSSLIDANAGTASSGLKLRMENLAQDPTLVYLNNGTIYIQQGSSTPQALTDDQVSVSSLQFQKFSQYPGKDVVQIDIAMNDASDPNALARDLRSAVSRASAATFDSPLLPGSNTYSIGDPSDLWGSGYFTGPVGIALGGQLGIGTLNPSYPLDIETADNGIFVSSTATSSNNFLLNLQAGTSTAFYVRNDGNIGIGTSTPAYPLDVQSSGDGVRIASTQNGSTTPLLNVTASSSPVFYVQADGNIGIGTSTPAYGLDVYNSFHVAGTSTFDGNIVFGGSTSTPVYTINNLADPTSSQQAATKAYVDANAGGSGIVGIVTYTTAGTYTWTKPAGVSHVMVEIVGGGGSGSCGSASNSGGAGGGAGGYCRQYIDVSSLASATVIVGAGGASLTSTSAAGNAGGSSSFSASSCVVNGGNGSYAATINPVVGGSGGTASGGDLSLKGSDGETGNSSTLGGTSGGSSFFGGAGRGGGQSSAATKNGGNGSNGSGGGGADSISFISGAGGDGVVVITEYK